MTAMLLFASTLASGARALTGLGLVQVRGAADVADAAVRSAAEERFRLFGAYSLADPWFLLIVPIGVLATAWGRMRFGRERGRVGVVAAQLSARSWRQRLTWIPTGLQLAALVAVSIAMARPLRGSVESSFESEGIDIGLVIDRSDSMRAPDLDPPHSRLDVVKDVVAEFASRRMTDREGAADKCALITFAAYPELLCPFTLDVDAIQGFLAKLEVAKNSAENGTAIGIGLAKAVQVLRQTDARSKIVVLLTDGENNIDVITPMDAADLAAREKIKVYTIFAGRYVYRPDPFGGGWQPTDQEVDTTELEKIASVTGGKFFKAKDKEGLKEIYAEIEQLERTQRQERRWSETFDLYLYFLVPGFVCYLLAWLSASTFARRLT